jgi:hypothetical protein
MKFPERDVGHGHTRPAMEFGLGHGMGVRLGHSDLGQSGRDLTPGCGIAAVNQRHYVDWAVAS